MVSGGEVIQCVRRLGDVPLRKKKDLEGYRALIKDLGIRG